MDILVIAFYKFVDLPDFAAKRDSLRNFCNQRGIKGTILLAHEGINSTVAGPEPAMRELLDFLRSDQRLADLVWKESWTNQIPFQRMKVRLKKEIVTLGMPEINPNDGVGTYVDAAQWNTLINDPEVIVIDTRNDYEVEIGTFPHALNPKTDSFREFPAFVEQNLDPQQHPKVAMFCTGGIRCEKATAYMLRKGFQEVYHLEGGILKYLETVEPSNNQWQGECYVFDQRVAVDDDLKPGHYDLDQPTGLPRKREESSL
ncbi:rhodanese-related sulfurtransferase [Herpetosiphon giganteus]|uniref:oxygen-dependent tRNA uridine(34) hydroxylase TrhO n=1 Tax=Herpetosiphon giganteus TaxID=2029754 RepID=UPI00195E5D75|nr:rhodanese-related sulfurtransferase [Herpetosiphon giganteus]MBM7845086.1 UPF0176 protein [Herpetosiphon giganteus]